jgi:hypothetical protein
MKEYSGLKMLRKTRSDALEGLSSLSREGSWSDDGDGDGGDSASVQGSNYAAEEGDRAMTDANPSALKRRYPPDSVTRTHTFGRCEFRY